MDLLLKMGSKISQVNSTWATVAKQWAIKSDQRTLPTAMITIHLDIALAVATNANVNY